MGWANILAVNLESVQFKSDINSDFSLTAQVETLESLR